MRRPFDLSVAVFTSVFGPPVYLCAFHSLSQLAYTTSTHKQNCFSNIPFVYNYTGSGSREIPCGFHSNIEITMSSLPCTYAFFIGNEER